MRPESSTTSGMHQTDPLVVGLVGTSGSGKTTLALKLIAHWTATGQRVATIKHAHAGFDIDHPGKDSMRHREAGACEVLVSSPKRIAYIQERDDDEALFALLNRITTADIILVEGFKAAGHPKLEIYRPDNGKQPLTDQFPDILDQARPGGVLDLNDVTAVATRLEAIARPRSQVASPLIYLDHNATTPISPTALVQMTQAFQSSWGNAGAVEHGHGHAAARQLDAARDAIGKCIGATADELIVTSGATEANNMAVLGSAKFRQTHEGKSRIIVAATEHKCVLEAAKQSGLDVSVCPVLHDGTLDWQAFERLLGTDVALVSLMLVNNETGVIQDVGRASRTAKAYDIKVHCDAAQGLGKTPIDVDTLGVDFLSLSAHKAYGPMGIGALYVRRRPRARLSPLVFGGGQERGLRSGTVPLPLVVGFASAAEEAVAMQTAETARLSTIQTWFEQQVQQRFPAALVKNSAPDRVANTINISFPDIPYTTLFDHVTSRFAISSGSACSAASIEPSYVLTSMGVSVESARSTLRIGMGRSTTRATMQSLLDHLEGLASWSS